MLGTGGIQKMNELKYCDRCSEPLPNGSESMISFVRYRTEEKKYRLCKNCTIEFVIFLEGRWD